MIVSLWVTDFCNMDCSYCYISKNNPKEMSVEMQNQIMDFIDYQVYKQNPDTLSIKFFGGEPLLKYEFIKSFSRKLVNRVKIKNPIGFLVTTNGTLLTKEVVDFFAENNFKVSLSVDGIPAIHNKYRKFKEVGDVWSAIEKNIDYILKKMPNTIARMTYTSETVSDLQRNIEFLANKGFKKIKPVPDYFDPEWTEEKFEVLCQQLFKVLEDYETKYKKRGIDILSLKEKVIKKRHTGCTGGKTSFSIASDGEIYPCTYVVKNTAFSLGNIKHSKTVFVPEYSKYAWNREQCKGCIYFECCDSSRCIYLNHKMTGKMDEPNGFFCAQQRLMFDIGEQLTQKHVSS